MRDVLVTLDAGTGSGRCVAFDLGGRPLKVAEAKPQESRGEFAGGGNRGPRRF